MYKILSEKLRSRRILFTVVRKNYTYNKNKQNCIYNKTFKHQDNNRQVVDLGRGRRREWTEEKHIGRHILLLMV